MWETFKPKDEVWYCWQLNGGAAYLRKDGSAWRLGFNTVPFHEMKSSFSGPEIVDSLPESVATVSAWGLEDKIILRPHFGTLPYMLKVKEKARISPGQKVCFTAALPSLLKFELELADIVLAEAMPVTPRKTFFSTDTMSGQFSYILTNALVPKEKDKAGHPPPSSLINCDIIVKNSSKIVFEMDDFIVQTDSLNIYVSGDKLITDTLEFEFFGGLLGGVEQKTTISTIKNADCRLITSPSKSGWVGDVIARQSVDILKNIARGVS